MTFIALIAFEHMFGYTVLTRHHDPAAKDAALHGGCAARILVVATVASGGGHALQDALQLVQHTLLRLLLLLVRWWAVVAIRTYLRHVPKNAFLQDHASSCMRHVLPPLLQAARIF